MIHDPLCALHKPQHSARWCYACRLIARARADEREQAAQRVIALCAHTKYEGSAPCEHDRAAAAVRGES